MKFSNKYVNMDTEPPKLSPKYLIYGAFGLGLTTSIAVRALVILNHIQPNWVRPVWYFAVIGNFIFFYYRYVISEKRKKAVRDHQLVEKLTAKQPLSANDREVLIYLLSSITKSLEHINYLLIFAFSLLAIGIDLVLVYWLSL